ncbi:hypothetical protein F5Y19DRAFT_471091 [Xylariaceae sp. FL1651]|nr:hypothetical protein F5Y19DRAFT_471091 [Xylariaceae sp. FL1651]
MYSYTSLASDKADGSASSDEPGDHVDNATSLDGIRKPRYSRILLGLRVLKDVILVILALVAIVLLFPNHRKPIREGCDCGGSIAEARELGCQYDTLASAWLPQHCIDKELTAEFDLSGDGPNGTWQYWADVAHQRELTLDQLAALAEVPDAVYFTSSRWHVIHCLFYWRKQMRQPSTRVTIEPRYNHEGHVKHCGMVFQYPELGSQAGVVLNSNLL